MASIRTLTRRAQRHRRRSLRWCPARPPFGGMDTPEMREVMARLNQRVVEAMFATSPLMEHLLSPRTSVIDVGSIASPPWSGSVYPSYGDPK